MPNFWQGNPTVVITTVQKPTACVEALASFLADKSIGILIIGDQKGPFEYPQAGTELWTLARQRGLPLKLQPLLPIKHYARKNIGYLVAISRRSRLVYETDDDNSPLNHWQIRAPEAEAIELVENHWINVYRWFSEEQIWPRGLPLEQIRNPQSMPQSTGVSAEVYAPIQQGLANGSPDVDAIWRLILDRDFTFERKPSVILPRGSWCPFNSQSTWWWPEAYPLLYLPSYCSFRMTDIWRSFVAQRCLWELGAGMVFHTSEVHQDRNEHSLQRDFEAEVAGYIRNDEIVKLLNGVRLSSNKQDVGENLRRCYEALIGASVFPSDEQPLVSAWCDDLETLRTSDLVV